MGYPSCRSPKLRDRYSYSVSRRPLSRTPDHQNTKRRNSFHHSSGYQEDRGVSYVFGRRIDSLKYANFAGRQWSIRTIWPLPVRRPIGTALPHHSRVLSEFHGGEKFYVVSPGKSVVRMTYRMTIQTLLASQFWKYGAHDQPVWVLLSSFHVAEDDSILGFLSVSVLPTYVIAELITRNSLLGCTISPLRRKVTFR